MYNDHVGSDGGIDTMATVKFGTKLKEDSSLAMPMHAVEELGIHPGDKVRVSVETIVETGRTSVLSRARRAMISRSPERTAEAQALAMDLYQPFRAVPPGKTLEDVVSGQWPGDESDDQIEAALQELS